MTVMTDLYDRLESRAPQTRETALFRDLRHILTVAKARVPALRAQLKGVDIAKLTSPVDLVGIPIVRRRDIAALQRESPPFGGTCAARAGTLRHIFPGVHGVVVPEGQAKDWWGAARALYAAGLRKGMITLNCFPYENALKGHIIASGAAALGCPVIPVGTSSMSAAAEAVTQCRPRFYCGPAEHLKRLLDHGIDRKADTSSLTHAFVTGPLSAGLRSELSLRGIALTAAFATPELGLTAFEVGSPDVLTLNEGLILEIVNPATGLPLEPGQTGEMVVTRLNPDFPLLRFGTEAMSSIVLSASPDRRTNTRLRTPVERGAQCAELLGQRIHPEQIVEIARRHPTLGRLRLVVRRAKEQDVLVLRAEHCCDDAASLTERLCETLHKVTQMRGTVELLQPGSLRDDECVIVDERPLN